MSAEKYALLRTFRELRKKGHDVRFDVGGYGGYQAIKVEMHDGQRVYVGASESRKDGRGLLIRLLDDPIPWRRK